MEKKISDLSLVEQAWSSALIKTNSIKKLPNRKKNKFYQF